MKKSAQVHQGFTLVELLVVIAIIAILAAVVVLVINPLELTRRGRDAARLADLATLQSAINLTVQEAAGPLETILCPAGVPCTATSNGADGRGSDGSGWVKVDLTSSASVSMSTLPVDPTNSGANVYTYCANATGWEINANLESNQQAGKLDGDGGDAPLLYEVGSNLKTCGVVAGPSPTP